MKSMWEWLEIEPTTDVQTIRKAYSQQAKKYHPEENPEEFKQVRDAYKKALSYAKSDEKSNEKSNTVKPDNDKTTQKYKDIENVVKNFGETEKFEYTETGKDVQDLYNYDLNLKINEDKIKSVNEQKQTEEASGYTYHKAEQTSLNDTQQKQLETLIERIKVIYADDGMRNNIWAWRMLFSAKDCNYKANFDNLEFVSVVINLLYEMRQLRFEIIKFIGKKIFVSKKKDTGWQYIEGRFAQMQQNSRNADIKKMKNSESPGRMYMAQKLFGVQSKAYKRYRWLYVAVMAILVVFFFGRIGFRNAGNSEQMRYELKFMMDLDDDGVRDYIKYDNKKKEMVLELFNSETGEYEMWGTLEDYCEKYPEAQKKVSDYYTKE